MKRTTCKEITLAAMFGSFCHNSIKEGLTVDETKLNDTMQLYLRHVKKLYDAMVYSRRKPEAVAWECLLYTATAEIADEYNSESHQYHATSEQMKYFLNRYGRGYDSIAETVDFIRQKRAEMQEEMKEERQ